MGDAAQTVDKKTGLRFGFINHKLCKKKGVLQNTPFSKLGFIVHFVCFDKLPTTVSLRGGATPRRGNLPVRSYNYNCTQNRSIS